MEYQVDPVLASNPTSSVLPHPRSLTTGDIIISGRARVHIGDSYISSQISEPPERAVTRLRASLTFPHRYGRFEHIKKAYPSTYQWLLCPSAPYTQQHDCFATWISNQDSPHRLYWIYGKPGSGKSTVMKFLFNSLSAEYLGIIWPDSDRIVRAHHFFWSSGTVLQHTVDGLCRSLIIQVLDQRPDLLHCTMSSSQLVDLGNHTINWTRTKLIQALLDLVRVLSQDSHLLLIIDGLDECGGDAEEQDELLDLLLNLEAFERTKICVASRAWNAPRDAFVDQPQLRLEDLTREDIETFVVSQLSKSRRWSYLKGHYEDKAGSLITNVVDKAEGVFLWVRLVIRDILVGLRDGDGIDQLQQTLDAISPELDTYFMTILHSIEQKYRREASTLLQLALFWETKYASVLTMTLMDAFFMAETREDFAIREDRKSQIIDLRNRQNFLSVIDSTGRKLISRCKGLLECDYENLGRFNDNDEVRQFVRTGQGPNFSTQDISDDHADWIEVGFRLNIEFLHRSLRDFLMRSDIQDFLCHQTGGRPLDTRLFLSSARAMQLQALVSTGRYGNLTVGLASHVLSAMWVNRTSETSLLLGETLRESIEQLAAREGRGAGRWWYVSESLEWWSLEKSDFLTLAIDFDLSSYVYTFMTPLAISKKTGRPVLDYMLRPRFATRESPGCEWVNPTLVKTALDRGSDPNEMVEGTGISVWAAFLCFLVDMMSFWGNDGTVKKRARSNATFEALLALAHAGAVSTLPTTWLVNPQMSAYTRSTTTGPARRRWLETVARDQTQEGTIAVSRLIQSMRDCFRFDIRPLIDRLNQGESEACTQLD